MKFELTSNRKAANGRNRTLRSLDSFSPNERKQKQAQKAGLLSKLNGVKANLLSSFIFPVEDDHLTQTTVKRAAEDALTLAWATPFPLLVLPTLFEELALKARSQAAKQREIYSNTSTILSLSE